MNNKISFRFLEFIRSESAGGILLMITAALAMVLANTPLSTYYDLIITIPVHIRVGPLEITKPLLLWVNGGLMVAFFFLVRLELKRELLVGELSDRRKIALAALGALGGMLVPSLTNVAVFGKKNISNVGYIVAIFFPKRHVGNRLQSKSISSQRSKGLASVAILRHHFEEFELRYDEVFSREHGFYRPIISHVVHKYLKCGDLQDGFARVRCPDCHHEYLLAYSCRGRWFCPSCHSKKVVQFAHHLKEAVLYPVPYWQYVFSIPKILRKFFFYNRKLLGKLSQCAAKSLA
jgi:hypothetical protein